MQGIYCTNGELSQAVLKANAQEAKTD
jgi:hypothetical protein